MLPTTRPKNTASGRAATCPLKRSGKKPPAAPAVTPGFTLGAIRTQTAREPTTDILMLANIASATRLRWPPWQAAPAPMVSLIWREMSWSGSKIGTIPDITTSRLPKIRPDLPRGLIEPPRGGGWSSGATIRAGARWNYLPDQASNYLGFRCVRTIRFAISGKVTNGPAGGVEGVTISDGQGHTVLTRSDGSYTMSGLAPGLLYTLTAAKTAANFTAGETILLTADAHFDFQQVHQVSGSVIRGSLPVPGVVISLNGENLGMTMGDGNYTISGVIAGTYAVSAFHPILSI